jgi:hypothetical protein
MRYVAACLFSAVLFAAPAGASTGITLLLQFDNKHSERSVEEMKREMNAIMKDTGLELDFRSLKDFNPNVPVSDLVVVKFRGTCQMDTMPILFDERGPLAFTHSTDGEVLPFSEVACDRVRHSVESAMWGGDRRRADLLLGRALGRVLAHELVHIVAKSHKHGRKGIAMTSLSGVQLIADRLELDAHDVERLHLH